MQRWQAGVQRDLGAGWLAEVTYVGNYGSRIQTTRNLNATPLEYLSTSAVRDQERINDLSANVPNPFFGLMPPTATAARRGARLRANACSVRTRTSTTSRRRPTRESRGITRCGCGSSAPAVLSKLVGGWQISGIYLYQSGVPVGFGNLLFTGNLDDVALSSSERGLQRWFNTDAGFNRIASQQLASHVRTSPLRLGSVRTDAINNVDLSLIKNTRIVGDKTLQIRFAALNAFNHPLFPGPNPNAAAVAFGTISASTQLNYSRRVQVMGKFLF